jgi:hypothetical protein
VTKLLGVRFLAAAPDEQRRVQEGVRKLADAYLTESIRAELEVHRRVPISVAQHGTVDDIIAVARHYARRHRSPVLVEGDACYARLPGFRDPAKDFPDAWYDCLSPSRRRHRAQTGPAAVRWGTGQGGGRALIVSWRDPAPRPDGYAKVTAGDVVAHTTLTPAGENGTDVRAEFPLAGLVDPAHGRRRGRICYSWSPAVDPDPYEVTAVDLTAAGRIIYRRGLRFYAVHTDRDDSLRLSVLVRTVDARTVARKIVRTLRRLRSR